MATFPPVTGRAVKKPDKVPYGKSSAPVLIDSQRAGAALLILPLASRSRKLGAFRPRHRPGPMRSGAFFIPASASQRPFRYSERPRLIALFFSGSNGGKGRDK